MPNKFSLEDVDMAVENTGIELDPITNLPTGDGTKAVPFSLDDIDLASVNAANASDVYLGEGDFGLDPNEYDFQLSYNSNNDYVRADRQSATGMLANATGRLIGTTATKFLAGLGYVGSAIPALINGDMGVMLDNTWSEVFNNIEDEIKDTLPIHKTRTYTEGNVLEQMSTLGFWTDDVIDGAAFALSSIVGAKGIGALGKTIGGYSKLAKSYSQITRAIKAGKDVGETSLRLKKLVDAANMTTITAFNTVGEAAFEAKDIKDSLLKSFEDKVKSGSMTQEEANLKASDAARTTFWTNMAILAPSNLLETSMLFKNSDALGLNRVFKEGKLLGKTGKELAEELPEALTATQKAKIFSKSALTSAISEGVYEENMQTALQNYVTGDAHGKENRSLVDGLIGNWANNFTTNEGQKSIALGAIIGMIPGGIGGVGQAQSETKQLLDLAQNKARLEDMAAVGMKDFFKRKPTRNEDGTVTGFSDEYLLDDNDNPIEDKEKLKSIFGGAKGKYINFVEGLKALAGGNMNAHEYIKNASYSDIVFDMLNSGASQEQIEELTDVFVKSEIEDLQASGYISDENDKKVDYIKDTKARYIETAKQLDKVYTSIQNNYGGLYDFGKDETAYFFKQGVIRRQFEEASNQIYLTNLIKDLESKVRKAETVESTQIEGVEALKDIQSADTIKEGKDASKRLKEAKNMLSESQERMKEVLSFKALKEIYKGEVSAIKNEVADDNPSSEKNAVNNPVETKETLNVEQAEKQGFKENPDKSAILNSTTKGSGPSYFSKVNEEEQSIEIIHTDGTDASNIIAKRKLFGEELTDPVTNDKARITFNFLNDTLDKVSIRNLETGDISYIPISKITKTLGKLPEPSDMAKIKYNVIPFLSGMRQSIEPVSTIKEESYNMIGEDSVTSKTINQHRMDVVEELKKGILNLKSKVNTSISTVQGISEMTPYDIFDKYGESYIPVRRNGELGYLTKDGNFIDFVSQEPGKDPIRIQYAGYRGTFEDLGIDVLNHTAVGVSYMTDGRPFPIQIDGRFYKNNNFDNPSKAIIIRNGIVVGVRLIDVYGKTHIFKHPQLVQDIAYSIELHEALIDSIYRDNALNSESDSIMIKDPKTGQDYAVYRKDGEYVVFYMTGTTKGYNQVNKKAKIYNRVVTELTNDLDRALEETAKSNPKNKKEFKDGIKSNVQNARPATTEEALRIPDQREVESTPSIEDREEELNDLEEQYKLDVNNTLPGNTPIQKKKALKAIRTNNEKAFNKIIKMSKIPYGSNMTDAKRTLDRMERDYNSSRNSIMEGVESRPVIGLKPITTQPTIRVFAEPIVEEETTDETYDYTDSLPKEELTNQEKEEVSTKEIQESLKRAEEKLAKDAELEEAEIQANRDAILNTTELENQAIKNIATESAIDEEAIRREKEQNEGLDELLDTKDSINHGAIVEPLQENEGPSVIDDEDFQGTISTFDKLSFTFYDKVNKKYVAKNGAFLKHALDNNLQGADVKATIDFEYREFWDKYPKLEGLIKSVTIDPNKVDSFLNHPVIEELRNTEWSEFNNLVDMIPIKLVVKNGSTTFDGGIYIHQSNFEHIFVPLSVTEKAKDAREAGQLELEYKRKQMLATRAQRYEILSNLLNNRGVSFQGITKTRGYLNTTDVNAPLSTVIDSLKLDRNNIELGVALSNGSVYVPGTKYRIGRGSKGNIFWFTNNTADGSKIPVKLNPNKISKEHARTVLEALKQADNSSLEAVYKGSEVTGDLTIKELLSLLTVSSMSKTQVNPKSSNRNHLKDKQLYITKNGEIVFGQSRMSLHNATPKQESDFVEWMITNKNYPVSYSYLTDGFKKKFSIGKNFNYNPDTDTYQSFLLDSGILQTRVRPVEGTQSITTNPLLLFKNTKPIVKGEVYASKAVNGKLEPIVQSVGKKTTTTVPETTPKEIKKVIDDATRLSEAANGRNYVKLLSNIQYLRPGSEVYILNQLNNARISLGKVVKTDAGVFLETENVPFTGQLSKLESFRVVNSKGKSFLILNKPAVLKQMRNVLGGFEQMLFADVPESSKDIVEKETTESIKEVEEKPIQPDVPSEDIKKEVVEAEVIAEGLDKISDVEFNISKEDEIFNIKIEEVKGFGGIRHLLNINDAGKENYNQSDVDDIKEILDAQLGVQSLVVSEDVVTTKFTKEGYEAFTKLTATIKEEIKEVTDTDQSPKINKNFNFIEGLEEDDLSDSAFRMTKPFETDYEKFDQKSAQKWLRSKLGESFDINITNGLIELADDRHAFGQARYDSIILSDLAEIGTEYHEAFHRVSLFLLEDSERKRFYNLARREYDMKDSTDTEIEEVLAEKFRDHMILKEDGVKSGVIPAIVRFFDRIWKYLKDVFIGGNSLSETDILGLFNKIDQGKFKNKTINKDKLEQLKGKFANFEVRDRKLNEIQSAEQYKEVINYLFRMLAQSSGLIKKEGSEVVVNLKNGVDDLNMLSYPLLREQLLRSRDEYYTMAIKKGADTNSGQMYTKLGDLVVELEKNFDVIKLDLEDYLASLNIVKIDDNTDIDQSNQINEETGMTIENTQEVFGKASFESSAKHNTAANMKLLLSILPNSNERSTLTGLPTFADFGPTWSKLLSDSLNVITAEDLMNMLTNKSKGSFIYAKLLEYVQKDENLKTQLLGTVKKARLDFINSYFEKNEFNFDVTFGDTAVVNAALQNSKEWSSSFLRSSLLFDKKEGEKPIPQKDEFNKIYNDYISLYDEALKEKTSKGSMPSYTKYIDRLSIMLGKIGITIPNDKLDLLINTVDQNEEDGLLLFMDKNLGHVFGKDGGLYQLFNNISTGDNLSFNNVFRQESALRNLAEDIANVDPLALGDSVLGASGNRYYLISQHTTLTNTLSEIKNNTSDFVEDRLGAVNNKNSIYLKFLKDNPELASKIELKTLAAVIRLNKADTGSEYQKITDIEEYITRLSANNKGYSVLPTPGDRKFYQYLKGLPRVDVKLNDQLDFNEEVYNTFEGYLIDEIARVDKTQTQIIDTIKGEFPAKDLVENLHFRFLIDANNGENIVKNGQVVVATNENGEWVIVPEGGSPIHGNGKLLKDANGYTGRGAKFILFPGYKKTSNKKEYIKEILNDRINDELDHLEKLGIVYKAGEQYNGSYIPSSIIEKHKKLVGESSPIIIRNIVADNTINTLITGIETSKVFTADIASFKSVTDQVKRITGYTSTGDNLRTNFPTGIYKNDELIVSDKYNVTTFTSHVKSSDLHKELVDYHMNYYIDNLKWNAKMTDRAIEKEARKIAERKLKGLLEVDQTDAQTFITNEMYRAIAVKLGEWSDAKENAYQLLVNGDELTHAQQMEAYSLVSQPLKLTYMKTYSDHGQSYSVFDKMSLSTLYRPTVKGTQLEDLLDRMEAKGKYEGLTPIHQVKFHTAEKAGIKDRRSFFSDESENSLTDLSLLSVYSQDFNNLRKQLVTDPHDTTSIALGSQFKKVAMANVVKLADYINIFNKKESLKGKDILKEINSLIEELSDRGAADFKNELKLDDNYSITDKQTLIDKLKKEARKANVAQDIVDSFKLDENGDFYLDLDAIPNARKWTQSRLVSLVKKATIDLNMPGNSFIQMSNIGLRKIDKSDDLRWNNEEGFIEAAVSVNLFKHIIPDYQNKSDEQREQFLIDHPELVAMGYRVPTQGQNSTYALKIVRFLPEHTGDVIVLPMEGPAIGGFDYDIDKMFVVRHNYKNGKRIEFLTNENSSVIQRANVYSEEALKSEIKEIKKKFAESQKLSTEGIEDYDELIKHIKEGLKKSMYLEIDSIKQNWVNSNLKSFENKSIIKQNTEAAVQNRLLDMYFSIWMSDHHKSHRTQPLGDGADRLKGLSKLVRKWKAIKEVDDVPLKYLSPSEQIDVKSRFKFGGAGIGPNALANVHHILSQGVDLGLFIDLGIGNTKEDNGTKVTSLSELLGHDNEYITEWFSALVDAHVDIAADPWIYYLNANDYTNPTITLLIRAGLGGINTFKFIAQPILEDLAKTQENKDNKLDINTFKMFKQVKEDYLNKYTQLTGETKADLPIGEKALKEVFDNILELENSIKKIGNDDLDGDFYRHQLTVLEAFNYLQQSATDLKEAILASRVDTKQFGSTAGTIESYENKVNKALAKTARGIGIRNFDALFSETYLGAQTVNAINMSKSVLGSVLLEGKPAFVTLRKYMFEQMGIKYTGNEDVINKVSNEIYTQSISEFFTKTLGLEKEGIAQLVYGNNSIPRKIQDIKNGSLYPHLRKNELINILFPDFDQDTPGLLAVKKPSDKFDIDTVTKAWRDLLSDSNPKVVKLAKDLYKFSYLSSGFNTTGNSFFEYAPKELVKDVGFDKYVKQLKEQSNNVNALSGMSDSIFENGWNSNDLVAEIKGKHVVGKMMKEAIIQVTPKDYNIGENKSGELLGKPYLKRVTDDDIKLYKFVGYHKYTNNFVYRQVPRKGFFAKGNKIIEHSTQESAFKNNYSNVPVMFEDILAFESVIHEIKDGKPRFGWVNDTVIVDDLVIKIAADGVESSNSDRISDEYRIIPLSSIKGITTDVINVIDVVEGGVELDVDFLPSGFYTTPSKEIVHLDNMGDKLYDIVNYGTIAPSYSERKKRIEECK